MSGIKKPKKSLRIIARRIRAKRLQLRFTREQVAVLLAIPLQNYAELEDGNIPLTPNLIEDFSNLYQTNSDYFDMKTVKTNDVIEDF